MQKLAEICIRRPVLASVLVLILMVVGVFGYAKLGVDRFPQVEFPMVTVRTTLPGAAPEEVESEITDKLEESINTVSGIDELRSTSSEGVSLIFIQFVLEKSADIAAQEVRDRVNRVLSELPKGIDPPVVEKLNPNSIPVVSLSISSNRPIRDVTEYADKTLRRRLESVSGVGQINIIGGQKRQINVFVDPMKLRGQGLTVAAVERALSSENTQIPGGTVKRGSEEFTVRTLGRVNNVAEISNIPVARRSDHTVTIGDVARVEDGTEEVKSIAELDGKPAVVLEVLKQTGSNTVEVVRNVKERLEDIEKTLPQGDRIQLVRDESVYILAATHSVQEHLVVGSILAALVVFFFLANFRSTVIAAIAIPTSIISTFGLMWALGLTLNVLTLLALTLSVGIVVDDAIVVLENIYRYIEEYGYKPFDAAVAATREIGFAVLSITLSLVAVFLPIAFMGGIVGRYMSSFGITMAFAILVSMFVSFTLTPMFSARFLRKPASTHCDKGHDDDELPEPETAASKKRGLYHIIEVGYMFLLGHALRHRWVVVLLCVGSLAAVPKLVALVPKNFLPTDDESQFQVALRAPEGTSVEATRTITSRIARDIRELNGVQYTVATVGSNDGAGNSASIYVRISDVHERKFKQSDIMAYVRTNIIPKYKDEHLRTAVSEARPGLIADRESDVQYVIGGPDISKLAELSAELVKVISSVPGAVDVDSSLVFGKPQLGVTIDRAKAAELGVSVTDIANTLRQLVAGGKVSDYSEGGEQYDVNVRAGNEWRSNAATLDLVTVPSTRLGSVPLSDVVKLEPGTGPSEIKRLNRSRSVSLYADVKPGFSQQAVIDAANAAIKKMNIGPEYKTGLAGRSKELAKSATAFFLVFAMSLAFMYLIIAAQFESWIHPITILLSLPLTLPFALISVLIAGESLNIFSMLGVLVLFSVVKKNSILQIDHTNKLRAQGMPKMQAMLAANKDRLRPILMTTVAFVAGMFPLLVSRGTGAATNYTISAVVIGGQTLSLLLTLIATPVAYSLFDDAANSRLWGWMGRNIVTLVNLPRRLVSRSAQTPGT
ncbi:MAG: efflux RND transporter permease subunit [Candidatus Sumerlaeaceae bacterium]|nr:efflux RND transporter permease subunit [Candidatus Sumerlaeaceae bacterium]